MTIILFILLVLALLLSLYSVWRTKLTKGRKIVLFIIRSLIFITIYCILFQPSFRVTRLAPESNVIPVIIDLSSSMRLFKSDSVLNTIFSEEFKHFSHRNRQSSQKFVFFGFGDSLRQIKDIGSLTFNDTKSIFPQFFDERCIKKSGRMLIVSDGNWANHVSLKNIVHEKQCYYIPLQQKSYPSYIRIEAPSRLKTTLSDTVPSVSINLNGYKSSTESITIKCRNNQRIISEKILRADSGSFNENVALPLPNNKAGSHLCEVNATLNDSVNITCYILHDVLPGTFSGYLYSSRPSLDRRFLKLAFNRRSNWSIINDDSIPPKKPDILVLFDWDKKAKTMFNNYGKSSVLFFGCQPCDKQVKKAVSLFFPTISSEFKYIQSHVRVLDLPPPSEYIACESASYDIQKVLILYDTASSKHESGSSGLPLLFEAKLKNRRILILAAKGIWRWDFWPKSVKNKNNAIFFYDCFIDYIQLLVESNTNRLFYVYPDISPVYETDSLSFKLAVPSYLQNEDSVNVNLFIIASNGDTVCRISDNLTRLHAHSFSLKTPPVKDGHYKYSCSITTESDKVIYSDSIKVLDETGDSSVAGHTSHILNELAMPVVFSDTSSLSTFFKILPPGDVDTVTHTIRLKRSWFILILIFTLFFIEWIFRRLWSLD